MSRQMVRQRPPADDDLQPAVDEEVRRLAQAAAGTTQQAPAGPRAAAPAAADRSAYFSGKYSPTGPDMTVARRMADLGVPDFLHHCVSDLVHVLRERGLTAALEAMYHDPTIDRRIEGPVRRLLAAIDREGR
jgi:hypothetical protein